MGRIILEDREKQAIAAIDNAELDRFVDEAITYEQRGRLNNLPLHDCGEYVSGKLRSFDRALTQFWKAKSAKKREETLYAAQKVGRDLTFAVGEMKQRLEVEEREGQLFHVFDPSMPLTENMRVRVSYRWRSSVEDDWNSGSILFKYKIRPRSPPHTLRHPKPKLKPSARKLAEDRGNELRREWEHLEQLAHWSVRDYFRAGHDGAASPTSSRSRSGIETI
ncbi:hypothetical protein [Hoeflea sp.]|uniref:hypothetical protein n=1 Tax=Hoeflea sp. TaxID=1940281 RepID=UPI003A8E1364